MTKQCLSSNGYFLNFQVNTQYKKLKITCQMMKNNILLALVLLVCWSCDLPQQENNNEDENLEVIEEEVISSEDDSRTVAERMQEEKEKVEEKREERNQKGDTIAVKSETLESFLPKKIDNYLPDGDIIGNPYGASGSSFSNAELNYSDGTKHLRIKLTDYNAPNTQHAESIAMWRSGLRMDNRKQSAGSFEIDEMVGWEIYNKRERRAEIMLAVSDRILLNILADDQPDTEYIKYVAKKMKLQSLAKY